MMMMMLNISSTTHNTLLVLSFLLLSILPTSIFSRIPMKDDRIISKDGNIATTPYNKANTTTSFREMTLSKIKGMAKVTLRKDVPPSTKSDDNKYYSYYYYYPTSSSSSVSTKRKPDSLFHYPYRVKFPSCQKFGFCRLEDFTWDKEKDKLGSGGFGAVYRALHVPTGTMVALKVTEKESIKTKPKHVEYEETIQRSIVHPFVGEHLCSMTDRKNNVYFALRLYEGGSLGKQIKQMKVFSRSLVQKYIGQLLIVLRHIHQASLLHRDIKPDNIMLDEFDNVKLIDWGLAIYDDKNALTSRAGTLEYSAPEVLGRKPHGRASDYYSIGVITYLLHVGKQPYKRKKMEKSVFIKKVASGHFPIPKTGDSDIDGLLDLLCEKDPLVRWENVYVNFEKNIRNSPFFNGFDWKYYESFSMRSGPDAGVESPSNPKWAFSA